MRTKTKPRARRNIPSALNNTATPAGIAEGQPLDKEFAATVLTRLTEVQALTNAFKGQLSPIKHRLRELVEFVQSWT